MYLPEYRHKFQKVFHGVKDGEAMTGDSFPGALCHNHASSDFPTPLKDDWTKGCNPGWTKEKKEKECFSYQEAAFGTDGLKRLESIHTSVDPHRLFQCLDGVGYGPEDDKDSPPNSANRNDFVSVATIIIVFLSLCF